MKKKERKTCYPKININEITDNKAFCKTITPFLSSKASRPTRITLIEKEAIIFDDQKVEEISNFFGKANEKLDIKACNNISNNVGYSDPLETGIKKYENHSSIVAITEKFNLNARFEFREVNLKDVEKEILNINTKIAVASNSIPAKVFQEASDICSPVLQQKGY